MKRALAALALAAVVVLGGCGDDDPAPPAPTPEEPTGGNPPADPGATPTGGNPPADPGGATPTGGDPPADPDAAPTGGNPPADSGAAPTDPATPPPTASAACAGLLPDDPGPGVELVLERAAGPGFCDAPITDGRGEWIGVGVGLHAHGYRFVRATSPGEPAGSLSVPRPLFGGSPFAPQPDGYHVVRTRELPGTFARFDATGRVLAEGEQSDLWAIQGVPGGGSVVLRVEGLFSPDRPVYRLEWLDAAGAARAQAVMPAREEPAFVVAASGNVLAFSGGQARWFDRDGAPLTEWFAFDRREEWRQGQVSRAATRADGSVVVGLEGAGPLRFEAGLAGASPPPGWVTSRAGATVATVRGGRANAFAFVSGASPCDARVEILTPAGESCGTVRLGAALCDSVTFGADRSVFTTHQAADGTCTWRWWSALLR